MNTKHKFIYKKIYKTEIYNIYEVYYRKPTLPISQVYRKRSSDGPVVNEVKSKFQD
jgi:hypothetical protein